MAIEKEVITKTPIIWGAEAFGYRVSNMGNIFKLKKAKLSAVKIASTLKGKPIVDIRLEGYKETIPLNEIIAETFLKKKDIYDDYIIHKDLDELNCNSDNLKWIDLISYIEHQVKYNLVIDLKFDDFMAVYDNIEKSNNGEPTPEGYVNLLERLSKEEVKALTERVNEVRLGRKQQ